MYQYCDDGIFVKLSFAISGNVGPHSTCVTFNDLVNGMSRLETSRSETLYVSGKNHCFQLDGLSPVLLKRIQDMTAKCGLLPFERPLEPINDL